MPRRMLYVRSLEHDVPSSGIVVPASKRLEVHQAQLPLPERIVDKALNLRSCSSAPTSSQYLMRIIPASTMWFFHQRASLQEKAMLFLGRSPSHAPHRPGCTNPIEDHDFTAARKLLYIALHVHLGFSRSDGVEAQQRGIHVGSLVR